MRVTVSARDDITGAFGSSKTFQCDEFEFTETLSCRVHGEYGCNCDGSNLVRTVTIRMTEVQDW